LFANNVAALEITGKGIKAGLNMATIGGDDANSDAEIRLGLVLGAYVTMVIMNQFILQPEIYFSQKGYSFSGSSGSFKFEGCQTYNYLTIPILFMFALQQNLNLFAGPSIGFFLNGESESTFDGNTTKNDIDTENINTLEVALIFGAAYVMGQIIFDARYSFGLTNVWDQKNFEITNNVFQLMIGWQLN